jgi:predicted transcriptional regulator
MKPTAMLSPEAPVSEAARIIHETDVSMLPIGNDNDMKGVVTTRAIAAIAAEPCKADAVPVDEITSPVMGFCGEDDELGDAVNAMRASRQTQLLVRNREGKTVGVISLSDIFEACPDIGVSVN